MSWSRRQPAIELFNGMCVEKIKIPEYFNDYYQSAIEMYNRYKRFGLPYAGGWAEQPEYIIDVLDIFESTIDASKDK